MRRSLTVSAFVLSSVLLGMLPPELLAQAVKVKREAMSPNRRSSGPPNYTAPAGPWYVSSGLRVVPKGMKVYLSADTTGSGAGTVTSFEWSITSKPSGSAATLDSTDKSGTTFIPDAVGSYIVQVSVNGGAKTSADTLFVSTFAGNPKSGLSCSTCHTTNDAEWKTTPHATIFRRGISGQLQVNQFGKGGYQPACIKCHTTGWEPTADNSNFGYLAKQAGWDTTWYSGYPLEGSYRRIPNGDTTIWNGLNQNHPTMVPVANIGCESCHGPGNDHPLNPDKKGSIGKSLDAGVCNQCHDAPGKYRLSSYWAASNHSTLKLSSSHASRSACWPCHNGEAFVAYTKNKTAPDYSQVTTFASISCATCHDPHSDANPRQLRTVSLTSLANGYTVPAGVGGKGQLCMNCHRARENTVQRVNSQRVRFADRFYPHYSPQADMFLGANAYEYGLPYTGMGSHLGLKDACVTCHMHERVEGTSVHSNHEMTMTGRESIMIKACQECHGSWIQKYDDIKATLDYDGNGVIEGVQTEIQGLLNQLKATLPLASDGEPVSMARDSMLVKNHPRYPDILPAIFNYYFVKNDWSKGVHNTKYAVSILRASLGMVTGVKLEDLTVPTSFELSQNFPNPFNPSTEIRFSIPKASDVRLVVYDIMGREVATLVSGHLQPGYHRAMWHGKSDDGRIAASGVYFYHLQAEGFTATKKMVLIK